jgi:hypothetical protein
VGELRVPRRAFALVLGIEAVPDHHPGRDAGGLVPGRPEARRARGRRGLARARRPYRRAAAPRHGSVGWIRQWIESVSDTLKGQLGLERHGGRTPAGLSTRIAQRLLAMAATIWRNRAAGEPAKRSLITYDH